MEFKFHKNDKGMKVVESLPVVYLEFPQLHESNMVRHGFSTRIGGVSEGIFSSMNLGMARNDEIHHVQENFQRMARALGVLKENMVLSKQTHTTNVVVVTEADAGNGITKENRYEDVDGMITNVPELCLVTFYADCVPLFFLDPVKKVIALSHSGWRGTVGKIGQVTIERMQDMFGCDPRNMVVAIGPSICQDCYEVSRDVVEEFKASFAQEHWESLFYEKSDDKFQLNLWRANEIILRESGIKKENLTIANLCTRCNSELMFSHRASKGKRGNLGAFLSLK